MYIKMFIFTILRHAIRGWTGGCQGDRVQHSPRKDWSRLGVTVVIESTTIA